MDVYQRRQLLARGDVLWPVQKSWHLLAIEGLVPDMLSIHEDLLVDRPVFGLDERLGGVCREVVGNERGTPHIRGVVEEKLRVVREELSALCESSRQHKVARLACLDVVEDRPNLGFLVSDRDQPFAVLRETEGVLLDPFRRIPANVAGLDVHDPGAVLTRGVARRRDAPAVRVPVAERVLSAPSDAENLARA